MSGTAVFAGTNHGVSISTNNGDTWTQANSRLSDTAVHLLVISGVRLFAVTDSAIYRADISSVQGAIQKQPLSQLPSFSAFPNPAGNHLWVEYETPNAEIELYDFLGQRLMAVHGNESGLMKWDVAALPAGMYVLRLRSSSTTAMRVIIIR